MFSSFHIRSPASQNLIRNFVFSDSDQKLAGKRFWPYYHSRRYSIRISALSFDCLHDVHICFNGVLRIG